MYLKTGWRCSAKIAEWFCQMQSVNKSWHMGALCNEYDQRRDKRNLASAGLTNVAAAKPRATAHQMRNGLLARLAAERWAVSWTRRHVVGVNVIRYRTDS